MGFHFESVKSFIQSQQTLCCFNWKFIYILWTKDKILEKNNSDQTRHFRMDIRAGRNYLHQKP